MASEATNMAVRGNMHMNIRVWTKTSLPLSPLVYRAIALLLSKPRLGFSQFRCHNSSTHLEMCNLLLAF